jgi:hypothetical protein
MGAVSRLNRPPRRVRCPLPTIPHEISLCPRDSVAIPAFGFSPHSPALSLPAVKGEVEGPLFIRHFFVACPLPTIPHGISLSLGDSVAILAFGFSRHSPALSLPAVKGEVEGPLFTRHFFVACPLPTIPHVISLCLDDSAAIPAFGFSRHSPLAPRHCNSNRHKHGLEMPVTPCVCNTNVVSNRHRFGGVIAPPARKNARHCRQAGELS